jgi:hypothetical protein
MDIRDNPIIKVIQQAMIQHNKVVAIFGTNINSGHYIWQKSALIKLFGNPTSEKIF